jgi:hypothetical protein
MLLAWLELAAAADASLSVTPTVGAAFGRDAVRFAWGVRASAYVLLSGSNRCRNVGGVDPVAMGGALTFGMVGTRPRVALAASAGVGSSGQSPYRDAVADLGVAAGPRFDASPYGAAWLGWGMAVVGLDSAPLLGDTVTGRAGVSLESVLFHRLTPHRARGHGRRQAAPDDPRTSTPRRARSTTALPGVERVGLQRHARPDGYPNGCTRRLRAGIGPPDERAWGARSPRVVRMPQHATLATC